MSYEVTVTVTFGVDADSPEEAKAKVIDGTDLAVFGFDVLMVDYDYDVEKSNGGELDD